MTLGRANVDVYNPDFGQDLFARTLQIHEDYYLSDTVIIRKCAHSAYENYYTFFIAITLRASRLKNQAKFLHTVHAHGGGRESPLAPVSYLETYERFETLCTVTHPQARNPMGMCAFHYYLFIFLISWTTPWTTISPW